MTPEEHYRRMMSALNEHGSYEEQQQRLYQLASSIPSHGELPYCFDLRHTAYTHSLRVNQIAAIYNRGEQTSISEYAAC